MKQRVHRFRVRFGREGRASLLSCLSLGLGDDRQSASGSGGVSLAIFITSMNCSESLASFTNCFFHFSGPPGFKMAKGMEDLTAFSVREVKRAAAEERDEYGIRLQKDSESQSKRQSHPSKLSEN